MKADPKPTYAVLLNEPKEEHSAFDFRPYLTLILRIVTVDGHKIRNPPMDDPMNNLEIKGHIYSDMEARSVDCAYRDCFHLELRDLERMVKLLRKKEVREKKLAELHGYPTTLGAIMIRHANALEIKTFIRCRDRGDGTYDSGRYDFHPIGEGADSIEYLADKWKREQTAKSA